MTVRVPPVVRVPPFEKHCPTRRESSSVFPVETTDLVKQFAVLRNWRYMIVFVKPATCTPSGTSVITASFSYPVILPSCLCLGRYKYMERKWAVAYSRGPQIFHISGNHLKFLGSRRVTNQIPYWRPTSVRRHLTKFNRPGFVHPCSWVGEKDEERVCFCVTWTSITVSTVSGHWELICPDGSYRLHLDLLSVRFQ